MQIPFLVFLDARVCLLGLFFVQRRVGVACGIYGYFKLVPPEHYIGRDGIVPGIF